MQKFQTDKLYIVGLFIVTNNNYGLSYEESNRFLKWIVVENQSDDYTAYFKDVRTGVKYFSSGFEVGDLFIDMDTIFSMNNFTHKTKLSKEEVNYYLRTYVENDKMIKIRNKRTIYEIIRGFSKELGPEKTISIVSEVMQRYDEENPKNIKSFLRDVNDCLELNDKSNIKTKKRNKKGR